MDPLTAISLATNIITFIDFGSKLIGNAKDIYDSASGSLEENAILEDAIRRVQGFAARLLSPDSPNLTEDERALRNLATKSGHLANDLLELLARIKPKDPTSKRHALFSAFKNQRYSPEKERLKHRFDECRTELHQQLNFLYLDGNKAKLQALDDSMKTNTERLREIQNSIHHLESFNITTTDKSIKDHHRQLDSIKDVIIESIAQERILNGLRFDTMDQRFDDIPDAHNHTFEWLFYRQHGMDGVKLRHDPRSLKGYHDKSSQKRKDIDEMFSNWEIGQWAQSRNVFLQWLSSGQGVFHFSAKPGAGKSTLMRLLYSHPAVENELRLWAGDHKLMLSSFFFWQAGTVDMQRSFTGMCRTLLYYLLKAHPDLTRLILPNHWEDATSTPQVDKKIHLLAKHIHQAFENLIHYSGKDQIPYVCFFIDGLDELKQTPMFGHHDLVDTILRWTKEGSGKIKFCVSSREHNAFMREDGFSPNQRIRLHDLTKRDLERYTRDRLRSTRCANDIDELVNTIVERAQGVFLWVAIAVQATCERLNNRFRPQTLIENLDYLPPELHDLFARVLGDLGRMEKRKAYRILAMLKVGSEFDISVPIGAWIVLEDYEKSCEQGSEGKPPPDFAMSHVIDPLAFDESMVRDAKIQLNGCCKGLIELSNGAKLEFIHRSVNDFMLLQSSEACLDGFDAREALSQICLLLFRNKVENGHRQIRQQMDGQDLHKILLMRQKCGLDAEPYELLQSIESWLGDPFYNSYSSSKPWTANLQVGGYSSSMFEPTTMADIGSRSYITVANPILFLTLQESIAFAVFQMSQDPVGARNGAKVSALICCELESRSHHWVRKSSRELINRRAELMCVLLDQGHVSPNFEMEMLFEPLHYNKGAPRPDWRPRLLEVMFLLAFFLYQTPGPQPTGFELTLEYLLTHNPSLDFAITYNEVQDSLELVRNGIEIGSHSFWTDGISAETLPKISSNCELGPRGIIEMFDFKMQQGLLGLVDRRTNSSRSGGDLKEGHTSCA